MGNHKIQWHLIMDFVCLVALGVAEMLIHVIPIKPSHRGFFCDDKSLQKPLQEETVSTWLTIVVGFSVSISVIILCEAVNAKSKRRKQQLKVGKFNIKCGPLICTPTAWQRRTFFLLFMFGFGALITNLFTDMGKVTVGRLRPYFIAICKPNATLLNCSQGFITEDICTGDPVDVLDARMSFPSGHASFSTYCMVFLALYLESSMPTKQTNLVKPFLQVAFLSLGLLCSLSRIFDYWHHWGDVLVGMFLGTLVAFFITFRSLRLFSSPPCPKCYPTDEVDFVSRNPVNNSEERADLNGDNQFPL